MTARNRNFPGTPWETLNIPWESIQIRYLFHVVNGSTPKSSEEKYWNGNITWATPEDISKLGNINLTETGRQITKEGYESCGTELVPEGSITITTRAPIGNLGIAGERMCTNQGCKSLNPKEKSSSKFFYYCLLAAKPYLQILGEGATFTEISTEELKSVKLPKPDLNTQKKIVSYIESEISKIDSLIDKKREHKELLSEKKKSLLARFLFGGVENHILKKSGNPTFGKIPSHWKIVPNKAIFREVNNKSEDGEGDLLSVSENTGVTLRSEKDVNMFESESLIGYKIAEEGDLVINTMWAWKGAAGIAHQSGLVSPSYHIYRPNELMISGFADLLYRSPPYVAEMSRFSEGVWKSRNRLYPDVFLRMDTVLPPKEEQREIVDKLKDEMESIEKLTNDIEKSIEFLKEKRQSIITKAVTGQVDIGDVEDDETGVKI
jgi:type I restriction enzyme S subunit